MPKFNIIFPDNIDLSCSAIGVLSTMLNVPEYDYCNEEKIHQAIPADSAETLRSALDELTEKHFLFLLESGIYAVNKQKITEMKII